MFNFLFLFSFLFSFCITTINNSFFEKKKCPDSGDSTTSPSFLAPTQWAIDKIELNKAWDISTGSSNVSVGIIDNGIRGTHEDLSSNINSSLSTISSTTSYASPLSDLHGHGTVIAGIIGADGSNTVGIAGVCWDISLVDLRGGYIGVDGRTHLNIEEIIEFLDYAEENGISIINLSYGSHNVDNSYLSALSNFDGLIVCSAGNEGLDIDTNTNHYYPSSYNLSNVISVGNSTYTDEKYSNSNYGYYDVDLFAPGTDITSTYKDSDSSYSNKYGTSYSAPYVTGVAALLKSINPTLTPAQIKSAILNNVDSISSMSDKCVSGGRLNAYKAALSVLPTFSLNQTINSVCPIQIGGHQWYKINPNQLTTKQLYNSSSMDLTVSLYSDIQSTTPLASGSSNGVGPLFDYSFSPLGTYYLKVINNSLYSSNYSIEIHNTHYHSYGEPYIWQNNIYHLATCSCGNTISQPHAIQSGTNTCVLCHGTASGGFIGPNGIGHSILNDSYLLPNGIICLGNEDYNAYMNGSLTIEEIYGWNTL